MKNNIGMIFIVSFLAMTGCSNSQVKSDRSAQNEIGRAETSNVTESKFASTDTFSVFGLVIGEPINQDIVETIEGDASKKIVTLKNNPSGLPLVYNVYLNSSQRIYQVSAKLTDIQVKQNNIDCMASGRDLKASLLAYNPESKSKVIIKNVESSRGYGGTLLMKNPSKSANLFVSYCSKSTISISSSDRALRG